MEKNDINKDNVFFCYSNRLMQFLKLFGIAYIHGGINKKNGNQYYVYERTEKLGKLLIKWDEIKKEIPFENIKNY